MELNKYFALFANCIAVKGASRATVCDLQKGHYIFIPNELADILLEPQKLDIGTLLGKYTFFTPTTLQGYFEQLISFDLGHYCVNSYHFPAISKEFNTPYEIQDCIIELSDVNCANMPHIARSLANLGCQALELRAYSHFGLEKISDILSLLKTTRIRCVEIYLGYLPSLGYQAYENFLNANTLVETMVVHSADIESKRVTNLANLVFTKQEIASADCCGHISKDDFMVNLPFYLQGLKHNTCLYKKVSVKADGSIGNCPSLSASYGNIAGTSLEASVRQKKFSRLWNISKDKIATCRDCEFRYICSDCRAFVSSDREKPAKCSYDPYTMSYETAAVSGIAKSTR